LPGGDLGTRATLEEMARLIHEGTRDWRVIQAARAIVAEYHPLDHLSRVNALFEFVRDKVRYVKDPVGVELLAGAPHMIEEIGTYGETQGDCDEKTILLGAMLQAVGYPVKLVAARTRPTRGPWGIVWPYSHVYLETELPGHGRVALDPTRNEAQLGEEAPARGRLIYPVVKKKEFQACITIH
ncbi:MAG: transglutaminase-like domain-containing protein, partial [candidate division WOR-3 bacterium]